MESASCYCVGAIGTILKNIYHLHEPNFSWSDLPPSDDDDYSSADETLDDENPVPYIRPDLQHGTWVHPKTLGGLGEWRGYPPKSAAPFTVTSATVAYAAKALKIVDDYYAPRLDDEDSDSSSDAEGLEVDDVRFPARIRRLHSDFALNPP